MFILYFFLNGLVFKEFYSTRKTKNQFRFVGDHTVIFQSIFTLNIYVDKNDTKLHHMSHGPKMIQNVAQMGHKWQVHFTLILLTNCFYFTFENRPVTHCLATFLLPVFTYISHKSSFPTYFNYRYQNILHSIDIPLIIVPMVTHGRTVFPPLSDILF